LSQAGQSRTGGRDDLPASQVAGRAPIGDFLQRTSAAYAHLAGIEAADVVAG